MLENKVLNTIKKYNLLSSCDKVLVGVSGGPDSTALLYLLNTLAPKLSIKIIIAHFNHGLRGRSSDLDEKFVKNTTRELSLDFISKRVKIFSKKLKHPNEEGLRKLRYDFFFKIAKKYKVNKIALAHTLDDQAETVLMRLIRGTGLYGLVSILPKRKVNSFVVIRPLIEITRGQIQDYLKKIKVTPRIDKTNLSEVFLRNKIRHTILKELAKINPNIKQVLARFAQQAAIDYDYVYQHSKRFLNNKGKNIKINLTKLKNYHLALQRMVVRLSLEKASGDLRTFTNKHWEEIQDLIESRPIGSIVHLTKGVKIRKEKENIIIQT